MALNDGSSMSSNISNNNEGGEANHTNDVEVEVDVDVPNRRNRRNRRNYNFGRKRILQKANASTDAMFQKLFRMQRTTFAALMDEVGHLFPPGLSTNGFSVKPEERMLAFLKFIGGNERYLDSQVHHCFCDPR
jgi:hypothetical protein